jgi:hypothetical protein
VACPGPETRRHATTGRRTVTPVVLSPEHAREALARWDPFPVDRDPRPIVLTELDSDVLYALSQDFQWRSRFDTPGEPESALPWELRGSPIWDYRGKGTPPIIRGPGPFATDRGVRELPAWMMHPPNRLPIIAMDPEFRRRMTWGPAGLRPRGTEESALAENGRTLTYRFTGTPRGYAGYPRTEVYETDMAVLVDPVDVDLTEQHEAFLPYMEECEVVVHLAAPLGNRVLIWAGDGPGTDSFGSPRMVHTPR